MWHPGDLNPPHSPIHDIFHVCPNCGSVKTGITNPDDGMGICNTCRFHPCFYTPGIKCFYDTGCCFCYGVDCKYYGGPNANHGNIEIGKPATNDDKVDLLIEEFVTNSKYGCRWSCEDAHKCRPGDEACRKKCRRWKKFLKYKEKTETIAEKLNRLL